MNGKRTAMLMVIAVASAMTLAACDQGSNASNTGAAAPTSPVAAPAHDGHDHGDHAGHNHGEMAPAFTLQGADGNEYSLSDFEGKWVVLEWINHGCPFVKKFYDAGKMQELQKHYTDQGVVWLSICSSAEGKQGYYTAAQWQQVNEEKGSKATATLLDTDGTVGKAYGARTTPHMYVINPHGELVYRGGIDDQPSADQATITQATNYVAGALDAGLAGNEIPVSSAQPYGCGVKYAN
jgi:peroxiredoxin